MFYLRQSGIMPNMRRYPLLYEINTRLFIRRMSEKYHCAVTLATVPEEEWQLLTRCGFDVVWLMGVWQRSPAARQQALLTPALRQQYTQALPDWTDDDIAGSPYAVRAYSLDPSLGEATELAQLKSRLNQQGLSLVLDFVPNHLARDHPWTISHPERFVPGSKADVLTHPDRFFSPDGSIYFAHGRDPNFPPWTDTVQVNFYSSELRQALINELRRIAEVADGVRCDVAMLALNDVFGEVWGAMVKDYPRPEAEFWAEAIGQVRQRRPDFLFLAEAYWGVEPRLQQMGFDFTYDKPLYNRLLYSSPNEIQNYIMSNGVCQERSARFTENHDEPRAVTAFGRECSLAAAVIMATLPGLRLFHDGQLEGQRIRLPVQLVREPKEATDTEVRQFYDRLLKVINQSAFHEGEWRLIEISPAGESNKSHHNLLAWSWYYAEQYKIVVVNYSPNPAQGWLKLPLPLKTTGGILFRDELTGLTYTRDADEIVKQGLYLDLSPYHAQILDMTGA
jgi:glycosidase